MTGELAFGTLAGETNAALGAATGQDGATGLGARAGQETKLTDTAFLRGLERSFHGNLWGEGSEYGKRLL
jgi:hypothetical protein